MRNTVLIVINICCNEPHKQDSAQSGISPTGNVTETNRVLNSHAKIRQGIVRKKKEVGLIDYKRSGRPVALT